MQLKTKHFQSFLINRNRHFHRAIDSQVQITCGLWLSFEYAGRQALYLHNRRVHCFFISAFSIDASATVPATASEMQNTKPEEEEGGKKKTILIG